MFPVSQLSPSRFLRCLAVAGSLAGIASPALAEVDGPFQYELVNGGARITGYDCAEPILNIPATIESYIVREIGDSAFRDCHVITRITLPEGLQAIGESAFSGCFALTQVQLPSTLRQIGSQAFRNCYSLRSLAIPEGVTQLFANTLANCQALELLSIPASLVSVDFSNFAAPALKQIQVDPGNPVFESVDGVLFLKGTGILHRTPGGRSGTYSTPPGTTEIGDSAFADCQQLTGIIIGEGVNKIGTSSFERCTSLKTVQLPPSLKEIGPYAFWFCSGLTQINLPANLTALEEGAFGFCGSLRAILMRSKVTYIGERVFINCNSLESVYFDGDAPASELTVFTRPYPDVYRFEYASGWGETFAGAPVRLLRGAGPWRGAKIDKDGWLVSDWYGELMELDNGWIWHSVHGWQFCFSGNGGNYLYDAEMRDWLFIPSGTVRWFFLPGKDPQWYWFVHDKGPANRWFWSPARDELVRETEIP